VVKKLTDAQKKKIAIAGQKNMIQAFVDDAKKLKEIDAQNTTLFDKAKKLVYGERQLEYGDFKAGYAQTLELYRAWNFGKLEIRSVSDLMMLMVFIKLSRNRSATKEDNIVDAIGYLEMHFRSLPSQIGNEK